MAYQLKLHYDYAEYITPDPINIVHKSKLENAKSLKARLEYYNTNIRSLTMYNMDGQISFEWRMPNEEIKVYCGCDRCKKAGLYSRENEVIYLKLRDKEVKRIVKAVEEKESYKEKLQFLLDVKGYSFEHLIVFAVNEEAVANGACYIDDTLVNLEPKTNEEIIAFNELVHQAFDKVFKNENGFTEKYLGFRYDVERKRLDTILQKALDPHLVVADLQKQIEARFDYPEKLIEMPLPNQPHINRLNEQILIHQRMLGFNTTNFFVQMANGLDVDLNTMKLSFHTLKRYYHEIEIFNFYKYLRGWKPSLIKNEDAPQLPVSKTKKMIADELEIMDKNKGWAYAFKTESDYNSFVDLLTCYFEFKEFTLPSTTIKLTRDCKTKLAKTLRPIHKELSEKALKSDTDFFKIVRILSHFENLNDDEIYKTITR